MYRCFPACVYMCHVRLVPQISEEGVELLDLELQMVVSYHYMLGSEPKSSSTTASILNRWAISLFRVCVCVYLRSRACAHVQIHVCICVWMWDHPCPILNVEVRGQLWREVLFYWVDLEIPGLAASSFTTERPHQP